jgi:hypothetical protein
MKYWRSVSFLFMLVAVQLLFVVGFNKFIPNIEKSKNTVYAIDRAIALGWGDEFLLSPYVTDSIFYIKMAYGEHVPAPFCFRVAIPTFVGWCITVEKALFHTSFGLDRYQLAALHFWALNIFFLCIGTYFLYQWFLRINADKRVVWLGVILFIVQPAVLLAINCPILDIMTQSLMVCLLYALYQKRWIASVFLSVVAILTNGMAVILIPALIAFGLESKNIRPALVALAPLAAFISIRVIMGYDPLAINYAIVKGQLGSLYGIFRLIMGLILCFGVTWIYVPVMDILKTIRLFWFTVVCFVLGFIFYLFIGDQPVRILSVLYPLFLVIPVVFLSDRGQARSTPSSRIA